MGNLGVITLVVVICSVYSIFADHIDLPLTKIRVPANALRKLRNSKRTDIDLYGSYGTTGTYYAQVTLGTPAKTFNVIVDTGSSDLIVYGAGCTGCEGALSTYNPTTSSTSQSISCTGPGYNSQANVYCDTCSANRKCSTLNEYGDGSGFTGVLYSDIFQISNISSARVTLAAVNAVTEDGSFGGVIDGLWGMAYYPLAHAIPVYDNLVSQGNIVNSFSMCLNDSNPRMYLGVDYSQVEGFKWTPITFDAWYSVAVNSISVGGTVLSVTANDLNDTIMDSGTTLLVFKTNIWNGIISRLNAMCSSGVILSHYCLTSGNANIITGSSCYPMTNIEINAYPTLTFNFPGAGSFDIPPRAYLVSINGTRCGGITTAPNIDNNILGDVFMQNFNIIFDRQNNKIGFGDPSTCGVKGNTTPPGTTSTTSSSVRAEPFFALLALFFYFVL